MCTCVYVHGVSDTLYDYYKGLCVHVCMCMVCELQKENALRESSVYYKELCVYKCVHVSIKYML